MNSGNIRKILLTPTINNKPVTIKLDTGSAVTITSGQNLKERFGNILTNPTAHLKGETIKQAGSTNVRVTYNNQTKDLKLCVVKGNRASLFGRDWINKINVDWNCAILN